MHIIHCNPGRYFLIVLAIRDVTGNSRLFNEPWRGLLEAPGRPMVLTLDKTSVIQISAYMADDESASSFDSGYLLEMWMLQ